MKVIDHDQTAKVLLLRFILDNIMLSWKKILLSLSLGTIRGDKNLRNILQFITHILVHYWVRIELGKNNSLFD